MNNQYFGDVGDYNIAGYVEAHDGINLCINTNNADGDDGYAHMTWYSMVLSRLTRTCNRCGYDPPWILNDERKCLRHTCDNWRYDDVFVWSPTDKYIGLEEAYEV